MTVVAPKQLIATNLRYGTIAKSLKVLAFADLSAKALFLYGNLKTTQEIAKYVAKLITIPAISEDLIKAGLDELRDDKKIFLQNRKWRLTKEVRDKMRQEVLLANSKLDSVIDRHFPKNIEKEKLKHWFNDAIVDFFNYNGDNWVESVCKGTQNFSKKIKTPDELLDKSVKIHFSGKEAEALKKSFRGFLTSTLQEDQAFLTSAGFAMFSARLVAADVGADPIMIEELKNATFLVDTNFLFALQLDSHKFTSSLRVLGKALKTIGIKLQYIYETKEEYERVWIGKKTEILKLFEVFPKEVVFGTDDDFIATALLRGCKQTEDFERFFDSIFQLPEKIIEGPILNLLDDEKVVEETNKAKRDAELKRTIQRWCLKLRPIWNNPKSRLALRHDAALVYVTEFEKRLGNNSNPVRLTLA